MGRRRRPIVSCNKVNNIPPNAERKLNSFKCTEGAILDNLATHAKPKVCIRRIGNLKKTTACKRRGRLREFSFIGLHGIIVVLILGNLVVTLADWRLCVCRPITNHTTNTAVCLVNLHLLSCSLVIEAPIEHL